MAIGQEAKISLKSYFAIFPETSYGSFIGATAATGASTLEPINFDVKTTFKTLKLDTISKNRGFTKQVQLDKIVEGSIEQYLNPLDSIILLTNSMGGTITSASISGGFVHSISTGDFNTGTYCSLTFQTRKGDTHHWQYLGGRVNTCKISAAVGEPVKMSCDMVFADATQAGTDIGASLSISAEAPFTFVGAKFVYCGSEASITTTAEQYITDFELTINNNLVNDAKARALGTNKLVCLPPTRREINLKITQRFDTTTSWTDFIADTNGTVQLKMQGRSLDTTKEYLECNIILPKVYISNTPDPVVGGAGDILTAEINFDCIVDAPSTITGRDIGITIKNTKASY